MYFRKKVRYHLVSVLIKLSKLNSRLGYWFDNYRSRVANNNEKTDVSLYYKDIFKLN